MILFNIWDHWVGNKFSSTTADTSLLLTVLLHSISSLPSTLWHPCATLSLTPIIWTTGETHRFFVNDITFKSFFLLGLTVVSRDDHDNDKCFLPFDDFGLPVFCGDDGGRDAEDPRCRLSPRQQLRLSRSVTELERLSSSELDVSYDDKCAWADDDVDRRWRSRLPRLGTLKNSNISSITRSPVTTFGNSSLDKKKIFDSRCMHLVIFIVP